MTDTEWFEGRSVEPEQRSWMRVVIEVLCFVCLGVLFAIALPGCATVKESPSPRHEVCMVQPLGQTDSGLPVVALSCVSPEVFAESQK